MPKREVTSAPWVPVPARAYTGKAPRARQHRAVGRLSAGAPRLHKSCRWRRPQSKGRSCVSGRARRDLRVRGGRGHLSERPGWPSGAPISRGSTVSMIAFGGRRGPHRSGSRCRGRPIERREAGREGCLWPNAASQGRPPDGSGGESERSTQNGRAKTFGGGGGSNSELPQAGFPESGEVPSVLFVSGVFILGRMKHLRLGVFTKLPPKVPHYRPLVGWSVVFGRTQGRQRLVGRSGYGAQVR